MCRNIRRLHNLAPPTTADEIRDAARQFVRKISGSTRPSRANEAAFERAIDQIAAASAELLESRVTRAPAGEREALAARARARWQRRTAASQP